MISRAKTRPVFLRFAALLAAFVLALFLALPAHSAPVKNATYEEFEDLVKTSTEKVPDLQALWAWRTRYSQPVYFGGGALRGLMKWLELQLRTKSVAQVKAMTVPSIDDLLIQKDADRDIYHDQIGAEWFRDNFPAYRNWDVLTKDFRDASLEAGGSGIEKLRVSPGEIDDPYGAVRAFYEGKINYRDPPESVFQKFRGSSTALKGNVKSALVLRALRFANEIPSVEIDESTLRTMRDAVRSEMNLLAADNYWVQKSLTKLRKSVAKDSDAVKSLSSVELTRPLARLGYFLGDKNADVKDRNYLFLKLPAEEQTIDDFVEFKKHTGKIVPNVEGMKLMLPKAKSPEDFIRIISPGTESPNNEYRAAIEELLRERLDLFDKLNPKAEDYARLRKQCTYHASIAKIMQRQLKRAITLKEIELAITNEAPNSGEGYIKLFNESVSQYLPDTLNRFTGVTHASELRHLKDMVGHITSETGIMKKQLKLAKNADDLEIAFDPGVANPTDGYKAEIKALKESEFLKAVKALPGELTAADYNKLKKIAPNIDQAVEVMRRQADRAKDASGLIAAFEPGVPSPTDAYLAAINSLKNERIPQFANRLPKDALAGEFHTLKLGSPTTESAMAVMRLQADRAKNATELVAAFDPAFPTQSDYYKTAITQFKNDFIPKFMGRLPKEATAEDFELLKKASPSIDASISVIRTQIERAKSVDDFIAALAPGVDNPNEAYLKRITAEREEHLPKFLQKLARSAPISELQRLKGLSSRIDHSLAIAKKQFELAKTADDFAIASDPGIPNPSDPYKAQLQDLAQRLTPKKIDKAEAPKPEPATPDPKVVADDPIRAQPAPKPCKTWYARLFSL